MIKEKTGERFTSKIKLAKRGKASSEDETRGPKDIKRIKAGENLP